jgi:hypothetical protein
MFFVLENAYIPVSFGLQVSTPFRAHWVWCSHGENVDSFIHATLAAFREVCSTYFPLQNVVRFVVRSSLNAACFTVFLRESSSC